MSIVCATHFSDSSFAAVRVAAGLARARRQALLLVSVLPTRNIDPEVEQAVKDALTLERAALENARHEVQTEVLHGPLGEVVGRFCTERGAQLLVIGDSRHQRFASSLDQLATQVGVPLLVVRDPKPFESWTAGAAPLKVMLALDHTWSSSVARGWIAQLAAYGPIDLTATQVFHADEEYERRGISPSSDRSHRMLHQVLRDETALRLKGLPGNVKRHVHVELAGPHVADHLIAIAGAQQVDVLVLGAQPRQASHAALRAVAHEVLARAPMSVACVPSEAPTLQDRAGASATVH